MDREALRKLRLFLFDLDGTLYLGERLFDFTRPLLARLRETGRDYRFLTNNSSRSAADYAARLTKMGVPTVPEDFITSAEATMEYLREALPGRTLYVCGTASLKAEFARAGISVTEDPDAAEGIVMGYDTELTYRKLTDLSRLLCQRPDLPYIATHPDLVCPTEFGSVPDCGSVCAMLETVSGRRPLVIGKPEARMPRLAMARCGVAPEQCGVVGDRLYTDIKCGKNAGARSILVLSGETTPEMLAKSPVQPDLVLPDAGEILSALEDETS